MEETTTDRWTLGFALAAFLGILAAFVVLTVTNHDGQSVVRLVVDLAAFLGLGAVTHRHHKVQRRKLDTIQDQTNGQLDGRIKAQVKGALAELLEEHLDDDGRGLHR